MQKLHRLLQPSEIFDIGVVARRELHALRRHEIEIGVVRPRHRLVHLLDHCLVLLGAGDGEHAGMGREDAVGLDAEAAGDDHAAVLGQGLADCRKQFLLGAVQKAAGVDHHRVGAFVAGGQLVAFGAKAGDDALGIDQGLGTAQADKADLRCGRFGGGFTHWRAYRGEPGLPSMGRLSLADHCFRHRRAWPRRCQCCAVQVPGRQLPNTALLNAPAVSAGHRPAGTEATTCKAGAPALPAARHSASR